MEVENYENFPEKYEIFRLTTLRLALSNLTLDDPEGSKVNVQNTLTGNISKTVIDTQLDPLR